MTNIVFIGEAWGETEANCGAPFVGAAGQEFYRMLGDAGFPCAPLPYKFISGWNMVSLWRTTGLTLLNTFNTRPPGNNIEAFYASPKDDVPISRAYPPRKFGSSLKFVRAELVPHLEKLHADLTSLSPNLVVPLGATAMWALGIAGKISVLRGHLIRTQYGKAIPCYHPAAVLRKWDLRHITVVDLFKARRESRVRDLTTTPRYITIPESPDDAWEWWNQRSSAPLLAIDIETERQTLVSEFGVATSPTEALWIPFLLKANGSYHRPWTLEQERSLWKLVRTICESSTPKLGQNLKYDIYFLAHTLGIAVKNWQQDTMLAAHAWNPELNKSLGFLGSLFLDEVSWKGIRKDSKGETALGE